MRDETPLESPDPPIGATTVIAAETRRRRYPRRIAAATAVLLAAVLGIGAASRDGRTQERRPTGALLAELGETASGLSAVPTRPAPVATAPRDSPPASSTPRPRLTPAMPPVHRTPHASVYDRRY